MSTATRRPSSAIPQPDTTANIPANSESNPRLLSSQLLNENTVITSTGIVDPYSVPGAHLDQYFEEVADEEDIFEAYGESTNNCDFNDAENYEATNEIIRQPEYSYESQVDNLMQINDEMSIEPDMPLVISNTPISIPNSFRTGSSSVASGSSPAFSDHTEAALVTNYSTKRGYVVESSLFNETTSVYVDIEDIHVVPLDPEESERYPGSSQYFQSESDMYAPSAPAMPTTSNDYIQESINIRPNNLPGASASASASVSALSPPRQQVSSASSSNSTRIDNSARSTTSANQPRQFEVNPRRLLPYDITRTTVRDFNLFKIKIDMKQPQLGYFDKSPAKGQTTFLLEKLSSDLHAQAIGRSISPPIWSGKDDPVICIVCTSSFSIFESKHHCRNCGYYVCGTCSKTNWPSCMVPDAYIVANEKAVRVCQHCDSVVKLFAKALRQGNLNNLKRIIETGNVNLNCILVESKFISQYPIHMAAQSGNLDMVKYLLEIEYVRINCYKTREPLMTNDGSSVLAVAAKCCHLDMMVYLIKEHGCSLDEINDLKILRNCLKQTLQVKITVILVTIFF